MARNSRIRILICGFPGRYRRRAGTVLVFLVAAVAIVTVMVQNLLQTQDDVTMASSVAAEAAIADALALSGIEIMACLGDYSGPPDDGLKFLENRRREFAMYAGSVPPISPTSSFQAMFGITTGPAAQDYIPPLEYPAIRDVALNSVPLRRNSPIKRDNDIRLGIQYPNLPGGVPPSWPTPGVPSLQYLIVPYSSTPPSILPRDNFLPLTSDSFYSTDGTTAHPGWPDLVIRAVQPNPGSTSVLAWWGPENVDDSDREPDDSTTQQRTIKIPPPSFIIPVDVPRSTTTAYRGFIYGWYARRPGSGTDYYMTSGRVRLVYRFGGSETLGPEVAISKTQIR